MAERKTLAEAIEEEEKKGKNADAKKLQSMKDVMAKYGTPAETKSESTKKSGSSGTTSTSTSSGSSSTKKNKVYSYAVSTENGNQFYTGDDAQLAYDEAKARKKEAKANGTEVNLENLLETAKEKQAAAEAEKKKKAAAAAATQKQQTPASTTPASKEPTKDTTAPKPTTNQSLNDLREQRLAAIDERDTGVKAAAELKAELQEKKQAALDRGSAKTTEEIKADKEAVRTKNVEKGSTAAYLPSIGLADDLEEAKKDVVTKVGVKMATDDYFAAAGKELAEKEKNRELEALKEAQKNASSAAEKKEIAREIRLAEQEDRTPSTKYYTEKAKEKYVTDLANEERIAARDREQNALPEKKDHLTELGDWSTYDLEAAKKQSERLQEMIDEIQTLSTVDVVNARIAGGKGTRQNETATAKEYQEQQEKANVLRAKKAALDAEIAKAEEWRLYALIPEEKDFLTTAAKGKAEYLSGEHLPNDMAKTQYREYVAAGGDPESYAESVYGYFSGPMLDQYTEDEKNIYYYLYATDKERAEQFAWFANDRVATDQKAADYEKVYELAKKDPTKILPTAFNIAGAAVSGVDAIGNVLDYTLEGRIRPKLGVSGAVAASTEAVTEGMSDAGKFLYGTGVSIAENAALIATMGPLAGLPMALSSAADGMNDALERGATDDQAILYGVASGIAEAAFEKISIDKLITMKDSRTVRQAVENVLIQSGIEASEEAMTTIANTVSDAMIMGDKAKLALEYQQLLEKYPPEVAEEIAFKNWWKDVGLDALGGAISGGVMSGGKIAYSHLTNRIVTTDQATRDRLGANVAETAGRLGEQMDASKADQLSAALQKAMAGKFVTNAEDKAIRDSKAAQIVFAQETGTEYNSGEVRAQKDIIKELTGIDPNAPTKLTEDFDTWNKRTSTEAENKKAPAAETVSTVSTESTEERSRKALAEKLGIKTGQTELKGDLQDWIKEQETAENGIKPQETAENGIKPQETANWRKTMTKEKAAQFDEAVKLGERRGNKVIVTTEIPGEGRHDPDGTIYLNPNAEHPVRQVLVHEFTHDIETSKVYERFSKVVLDIAERIDGANLNQMKEQIRLEEPGLDDPGVERELVARIAGSRLFSDQNMVNRLFDTDQTVFQKIKNWISDALTKVFGSEERKELLQAEKLYIRAMNSRGQVDGYGKEQNFHSSNLEDDIDLVISTKDVRDQIKVRDFTPKELVDRGIDDKPFYMNSSHLRQNILTEAEAKKLGFVVNKDTNYHGLGKEGFIAAIDAMDNVIEVYRWKKNGKNSYDENDYIVITQEKDAEGNTIIIPFRIRSTAFENKVEIGVNEIKSAYGKEDIRNYLEKWKGIGALTKVKNKRTQNALAGVQYSWRGDSSSFTPENIAQTGEKVNSQNGDNFKGSSYEEMLVAQREKLQKNGAKTGVTMTVDDWVEMAKNMVETSLGTLELKDPARALDKVAGRNKKIRNELYELIEKPLHESQGKYAANLKEKVRTMSEKFASLGIKEKSKESKAVQWIGEGQREINKSGETESYTLEDLKRDFPEKWKDIKEAADYCRGIYDQYLKDLNDMYAKIYPATKEAAEEQLENYRMAEKTLNKKAENLREVEKRILERIEEKRKSLSRMKQGNRNYAETENQILSIQKSLVSTREDIRRYETMAFEKETRRKLLAAQIESGDILKNRQIKARKDYFRHFQEMSDQWRQLLDVFQNDQRISTGLIGVSENTRPKTMWTSIAQERANQNYYTEDAVTGIMEYATIAEKLLAFNPTINKLRSVSSTLRNAGEIADMEKEGNGKSAGTVAQWVDHLANNVAGKTEWLDRITEKIPGTQSRKILKAINILNSRVKSNAILGNIRSALVQVSNVTNASAYIYNPNDWRRGVVALSDSMRNKAGETAAARTQSSFMERRYMDDTISELQKAIESDGILQKPKDFALWMLGAGDRGAAELIWHTAYAQYLTDSKAANRYASRNYANAVDYADDITRRSVAGRGEGDIALTETSKIVNLFAPFQIEVNNTWQNLKEQVGKKNAAGIVAFEIVTTALNSAFEAIINDRPLPFDFLDAFGLTDFLKKLLHIEDDEEEEKTFGDRFKDATGEFVSGLPMGTQVAEIIKDVTGLTDNQFDLFGEKDPTKYGTGTMGISALGDVLSTGMKAYDTATRDYLEWLKGNKLDTLRATGIDVLDAVAPVAFPWGGKQVSRTVQGLDQILQGGNYAYNSDGERYLKFPQKDRGVADTAKTLLLGRYGSERGQEYLDNGFKKLTPKETEQYEQAGKIGVNQEDFFDYLIKAKATDKDEEKRRLLLQDQTFTAGEKNRLDQILFPDKEFRDYQSTEAFIRTGLTEKQAAAFDAGVSTEDIESWNRLYNDLSGDGKTMRFIEILDKNKDFTPKQKQAIYEATTGKEKQVFTGEEDKNNGLYDALGLTEKQRNEVRYIKAVNDSQEETTAALIKAGYDEELATKIVKADSWNDMKDGTAEKYASTGLSDADQYRVYNIIQTTDSEEEIATIAKELGISEAEAKLIRQKATGYYKNSIEELTDVRQKKVPKFEDYGFTAEEIVAGYNALYSCDDSKEEKAELRKAFEAMGYSGAKLDQKVADFYGINRNTKAYR